jgi:hypothetical protein
MRNPADIYDFIAHWRETRGSELANTQSLINSLCAIIGVPTPHGSRPDDAFNDCVFVRRVFQDNGDGTSSFGRIDTLRKGSFIFEAKQGSEADKAAADGGISDIDFFGQTAAARMKRGAPGWTKAMVQAKGRAER